MMSRRVVAAGCGAALLLLLLARLPAAPPRPMPAPYTYDVIHSRDVTSRNETTGPTSQLLSVVSNNAVAGSDNEVGTSDKLVGTSDKRVGTSDKGVGTSDQAVRSSDKAVGSSEKAVGISDKPLTGSEKSSVSVKAPVSVPAPPPRKPGVVLTKDVYISGHSVPHPELCPSLGAHIRLLMLVTSAPSHTAARAAVRLTWGHAAQRTDIALAFVLGEPPDALKASIEEENALYNDIIIGNFVDSYSNLTLKTLSMLEWADTYCPRAPRILKTDDDMFINVPRLLAFMSAPNRINATKTIWGKVLKKSLPKRISKSKYYLSKDQYPGRVLPDFATGPAYLLTSDAARALLLAAPEQVYVRLEDVFMTGILADKLGIKRQHAAEFYNKKVSLHPCVVRRGVAVHMVQYHEQFELWRKLHDTRNKCS